MDDFFTVVGWSDVVMIAHCFLHYRGHTCTQVLNLERHNTVNEFSFPYYRAMWVIEILIKQYGVELKNMVRDICRSAMPRSPTLFHFQVCMYRYHKTKEIYIYSHFLKEDFYKRYMLRKTQMTPVIAPGHCPHNYLTMLQGTCQKSYIALLIFLFYEASLLPTVQLSC